MKSITLLLLAASLGPGYAATTLAPPAKLRCEYRTNPLGIDTTEPRLSWQLTPVDKAARGLSQSVLVPGMLYEQYGDLRVIETNYPAMKKWMDYMRGFMKGDLMPKDTYGDWCVPPESPELIHSKDPTRQTDKVLLATAYYQHLCRRMSKYAALLGKTDDAGSWRN